MLKVVRSSLRFVALTVLLAALASLGLPSAPSATPYGSALADLTASAALAGGCSNKGCDASQFATCNSNPGTRCKLHVRNAIGCGVIPC
jgi:hypothetical protein